MTIAVDLGHKATKQIGLKCQFSCPKILFNKVNTWVFAATKQIGLKCQFSCPKILFNKVNTCPYIQRASVILDPGLIMQSDIMTK